MGPPLKRGAYIVRADDQADQAERYEVWLVCEDNAHANGCAFDLWCNCRREREGALTKRIVAYPKRDAADNHARELNEYQAHAQRIGKPTWTPRPRPNLAAIARTPPEINPDDIPY